MKPVSNEDLAQAQSLMSNIETEVSKEASGLYKFIHDNAKIIAITIISIIVIIFGYGVYQESANKNTTAAQNELGKILMMPQGADKLTKLETFIETSPESLKKSSTLEAALTAHGIGELDKSIQHYSSLVKLDANKALGKSAQLSIANIYLQQGKAEESLKILEELKAKQPDNMKKIFNEQIAAAAESAKNYDKAILAYEELLENLPEENKEVYISRIATLQAKKNEK